MPIASFTALRIVTDSIFNSWNLAFRYMVQASGLHVTQRARWLDRSLEALESDGTSPRAPVKQCLQSENLSLTFRMGDEEVDHSCAQSYELKISPLLVAFTWNANWVRKLRTEHLPRQKMSSILL